jgi:carboxypeptidase T
MLINFVQVLTDAYRTSTGITQPGVTLSAEDVQYMVNNLDIIVFPQANPDGRYHSMTVDPMWRKNRRPADPGQAPCRVGGGDGPGVDLNRSYDFLWDFKKKFHPKAPVATSEDPCSAVYRGPSTASEPETANVTWLLDQYPSVSDFIDVHSFGELILYNWGDDNHQTDDPVMNFHNPTYDDKRGFLDDTPGGDPTKYREYLPEEDRALENALGTVMRDAIEAAHGRKYTVQNAVDLYPTSGTSDDWAYSRHFLDENKGKVRGFTIEWGPERPVVRKSFHPDYEDMVPIIEEVTAALLAFCAALGVPSRAAALGISSDARQTDQTG